MHSQARLRSSLALATAAGLTLATVSYAIAFKCPEPPAQIGQDVNATEFKGKLHGEIGKIIAGAEANVQGRLRDLSKKLRKEYPGANEAHVNQMIGSFCCQKAAAVQDVAEAIRLYRECLGFAGPRPRNGTSTGRVARLTVEQDDLLFEIHKCQRSGDKGSCTIQITNLGEARQKVTLYHTSPSLDGVGSYILDDLGNQYVPSEMTFGRERSSRWLPGVTQELEPGLAMKSGIVARGMSSGADTVSVVVVYQAGHRTNKVVLSHVRLTTREN